MLQTKTSNLQKLKLHINKEPVNLKHARCSVEIPQGLKHHLKIQVENKHKLKNVRPWFFFFKRCFNPRGISTLQLAVFGSVLA